LVFTSPPSSEQPPLFGLRHDVDATVWSPAPDNQPPWSHINTFNALGYVQASKTNRKFTAVPPNLSYALITDCNRHVFVYTQPTEGIKGNRAGEFVCSLSERLDILGLAATDSGCVYVLTEQTLFCFKIPL